MAYAVGAVPAGTERITKLEMTWTVGAKPKNSMAFFSPWFGMDPADNLNLIQPVNPWQGGIFGGHWSMYTEYFQWSPTHNSNSPSKNVEAGQTLKGSLVYDSSADSYKLTQTVVETGATSSQVVKCQSGKKYTLPYVVYEKTFPCKDYPPDGNVTFRDIVVECDGKDCASQVKWTPKVKDANCNMAAHIDSKGNTISITWDTSAASMYDNHTRAELFDLNYHGWATKLLNLTRPLDEPRFDDACHTAHSDQKSCDADTTTGGGCTWCKCAAVPSACWTKADATKLPPGVYSCDSL